MGHEMLLCQVGVNNAKASQDHLSMSDPLGGGAPSFGGGLNLCHLIVYCRQSDWCLSGHTKTYGSLER